MIEFKGAFHELQKEPNKEDVQAKVLQFVGNLLSDKSKVKPFGKLIEAQIKYGHLKNRKPFMTKTQKIILAVIVYIIVGLL